MRVPPGLEVAAAEFVGGVWRLGVETMPLVSRAGAAVTGRDDPTNGVRGPRTSWRIRWTLCGVALPGGWAVEGLQNSGPMMSGIPDPLATVSRLCIGKQLKENECHRHLVESTTTTTTTTTPHTHTHTYTESLSSLNSPWRMKLENRTNSQPKPTTRAQIKQNIYNRYLWRRRAAGHLE